uniref:Uncharacterized protein n=1 Tax=Glossina austeni TaxID=7395 RepID=A0A1A9V6E9_GLOAU
MFIVTINENRCSNNGSEFIRMFWTLMSNLHIGRALETAETDTSSCRSTPNWRNIFVAMFDHLLPAQFPIEPRSTVNGVSAGSCIFTAARPIHLTLLNNSSAELSKAIPSVGFMMHLPFFGRSFCIMFKLPLPCKSLQTTSTTNCSLVSSAFGVYSMGIWKGSAIERIEMVAALNEDSRRKPRGAKCKKLRCFPFYQINAISAAYVKSKVSGFYFVDQKGSINEWSININILPENRFDDEATSQTSLRGKA